MVGCYLYNHGESLGFQCLDTFTFGEVEGAFNSLIGWVAYENVPKALSGKHLPSSEALWQANIIVSLFLCLVVSVECTAFDECGQEILVLPDFLELDCIGPIGSHNEVVLIEELPFDFAAHHVSASLQYEFLMQVAIIHGFGVECFEATFMN